MDRILLMIVCAFAGAAGVYFYLQSKQPVVVGTTPVISEPRLINALETTEAYSANALVLVKERRLLGRENNAVYVSQWQQKVVIGVDFTGFDWKTVSGIGEELKEGGHTVSGTIPALKVLHEYVVKGSEKNEVASRIVNFDEDKVLGAAAEERRGAADTCSRDMILYRDEVVKHAMETVVRNLSAAMPVDANGAPLVAFNLHFENEADLLAGIAQRNSGNQGSTSCSGVEYVN
ncbi:hypothetical protein [Leisingera methylohalidivorans]|uniref:Uncharacterized protein n=1 Tax=Leisingera methylohalidivorans DSM 14336 TaxID=999552 RepID=V9VX22_9RHOB|nr:hypothetical protein [Leisingera methylohalidivorans]AHD03286.1 hypothetical protein METH_18760 [Leisingera methylohalidivorans DSM 14336]